MRRPLPALLAIALALALVAALLLFARDDDEQTTTATNVATEAGCEAVEAPEPKQVELKRPRKPLQLKPREGRAALVETSCGEFEIALDARTSPKTVSSFVHMAEEGLYDGTAVHRIVPGFVIQGGDPLGDGSGGPGYFVDEQPAADTEYTRGVVAMAKSGVEPPGRSGSQFFVVVAADAGLPPDYALLGDVSSGRGVVDRIGGLGDPASGETGTPLATVVIRGVKIRGG